MGKVAELVGAVMTLSGMVLFGVSLGTTFWYSTDSLNYGLFMACSVQNSQQCSDLGFDLAEATVFFPKVIMIGAGGFLGIGLFFHILSICMDSKTRGCCLSAGATFYIFGAILTAAAPAVLLGFNQIPATITSAISTLFVIDLSADTGFAYGYSFYLAWAAAALIFIAAIIDCIASCSTSDDRVAPQQGVVWSTEPQQTTVIVADPALNQGYAGQQNYYLPA